VFALAGILVHIAHELVFCITVMVHTDFFCRMQPRFSLDRFHWEWGGIPWVIMSEVYSLHLISKDIREH
jgi:hypothetical protein